MKDFIQRIILYVQQQYTTVLLVLMVVSGINYFIVINKLSELEGSAILIKLSSDQSTLINRMNYYALKMAMADNRKDFLEYRNQLSQNRTLLMDTHQSLQSGDRYIYKEGRLQRIKGTFSSELREIFHSRPVELNHYMNRYQNATRALLKSRFGELNTQSRQLQQLDKVTPDLLTRLDTLASFFQKQSDLTVNEAIRWQNLSFFFILASIIIVGALLLKPLVENLKKITLKARQEKAFSENIINTAETLIIGIDTGQNISLFNSYAEEVTGWAEQEVLHKNFFEWFIPAGEERERMLDLFTGMMQGKIEYSDEIETNMMVQTGETLTVVWHSAVAHSQKTGEPLIFLATGLDITERKLAEQQVQEANQKMQELALRLKSEVDLAATLQQSILPDSVIDLPGIQGQANLLTSSEVGGDYFDYYRVGEHKSVLLIGDVSGHGVAAGTMVSAAKAGVYPLVHEGVSSPSEILHSLNETMLATAQQSLLMTMACLSIDASNGKAMFANAGHVLPYIWRRKENSWEMLEASGLPLGKSMDADYRSTAIEFTLEVGDRLFLFTDGVVEEESQDGEAFGFDRLENILHQYTGGELNDLYDAIMQALQAHCGGRNFEDDVTIMLIEHSDRVETAATTLSEVSDVIRVSEIIYRQGGRPIPRVPREFVVFMAEQEYADLLPRFSQDGLCRIIPQHNQFCQQIGLDRLLNQHHQAADSDLYGLVPHAPVQRQFELTHTEDKMFIMEEIHAWLSEQEAIPEDHVEALTVVLDEMIENSLYAAPRDGKGMPYFEKGSARELSENDTVSIDLVLADNKLGLMIKDSWGTLTPAVFLRHITQAMQDGVNAGIGGAGLYMMWRLSDYFQIRVCPQQNTQVTTLWDLNHSIDMDTSSGFQFIYHSDLDVSTQLPG